MKVPPLLSILILCFTSCNHDESVTPDERPDTTSHSFTWKVERFGEGSSSALYDVAIVSDTLVFAVGEIYEKDSLGNLDPNAYNLASWNGSAWTIQRHRWQGVPVPIKSVFARGETDVWFDTWSHWDGRGFQELAIDPIFIGYGVRRMWGIGGILYAVSREGFMGYFNGTQWQKLATNTPLTIQDIWGAKDPTTGTLEILAVASEPFYANRGRRILRIAGTDVTTLSDSGITQTLTGVWFSASRGYYVSGGGIFGKNGLNDIQWLNDSRAPVSPSNILVQFAGMLSMTFLQSGQMVTCCISTAFPGGIFETRQL